MADIIYTAIMADKIGGDDVSPKAGRSTDNPKQERITVRLDGESSQILQKYCTEKQVEKAEAIRRGVKKLETELE